jgi:hypothetical protein
VAVFSKLTRVQHPSTFTHTSGQEARLGLSRAPRRQWRGSHPPGAEVNSAASAVAPRFQLRLLLPCECQRLRANALRSHGNGISTGRHAIPLRRNVANLWECRERPARLGLSAPHVCSRRTTFRTLSPFPASRATLRCSTPADVTPISIELEPRHNEDALDEVGERLIVDAFVGRGGRQALVRARVAPVALSWDPIG